MRGSAGWGVAGVVGGSRVVGRLGHASHPEIRVVVVGLLLLELVSTCFSAPPLSSPPPTHKPSSFPSSPVQPPCGPPLIFKPITPLLCAPHHSWLLQPPYFSLRRKCKISEVGAHTLEYVSLRAQFFHLSNFVQPALRWQTSWCNA